MLKFCHAFGVYQVVDSISCYWVSGHPQTGCLGFCLNGFFASIPDVAFQCELANRLRQQPGLLIWLWQLIYSLDFSYNSRFSDAT
ncbi:MAG: hypothetical protein ACYS5F_13055 [Planctomycetota bacterium]